MGGDSSRSRSNLPIAPYPSPAELYRLRMAELQKLLQANGTFKSELMQAFLSAAQASFREHAKTSSPGGGHAPNLPTDFANQNVFGPGTTTHTVKIFVIGTFNLSACETALIMINRPIILTIQVENKYFTYFVIFLYMGVAIGIILVYL